MEIISIILIIILLFLVNSLITKVNRIDNRIDILFSQIKSKSKLTEQEKLRSRLHSQEDLPQKEVTPLSVEEKPKIIQQAPPEPVKQVFQESTKPTVVSQPKKVASPIAAPKPSFMERNPDLEKFIGENLLSKIGIVIFVIGMGFLVKLGIDKGILSESMRVGIGIIIGGGMVALAHYLRNSFASFSSVLIGGALSVLYFTIALAFHEYALISQTAAFFIMVFITAFGVLLAIAYDRKSLAVLAIIGGFGTPFFVSTGSGNYIALLTYILILDIGMLTLVYFKKWNIINYLAYGFTYLLFIGVYFTKYIGDEDATRLPLFLFLTSFYLIFFLMTIIYNIKNAKKFRYPEMIMLLTNSSFYFGLGLSLVQDYKDGLYSGIFTALTAIFNFGFAFSLYKRKNIDKNLIYILIGLVLTLVTLIAPIQLKGNYITMFWAIESVLLFWLSQKSGIKLMKLASILVSILMLIGLFWDWQQNYYPQYDYVVLQVFLNKAFITSFVAMGSLIGLILLAKKEETIGFKGFEFVLKKVYVQVVFAAILYLGFLLELYYQFVRFEFSTTYRVILLGIYNYTFVIAILAFNRFKATELLRKVSFSLSTLSIVSYLTVYLLYIVNSRSFFLLKQNIETGYSWHYVLLVLFLVILVNFYFEIYKHYTFKSKQGSTSLWALAFISVFVISAEVSHISVMQQINSGLTDNQAYEVVVRSIFPIVWALSALILMIVGMRYKLKTLRIASLILFTITIVKLFFYDLAENSTGKIISFILLGVILLLISFLYQKLKFIIQDDDEKKD